MKDDRSVRKAVRRLLCSVLTAVALCSSLMVSAAASGQSDQTNVIIGVSSRAMTPNQTEKSYGARLQETAIGNLISDAFRTQSGSEIALVCGGNLVRALPGGPITESNIQGVFASDLPVGIVELTSDTLFSVLEHGVSRVRLGEDERIDKTSGFDGFLQISGFSFTYDASQQPGSRVREIRLDDGRELTRGDGVTVRAAMPANLTGEELGFDALTGLTFTPVGSQSQLLCDYIKALEQVEPPETDRITVLGEAVGLFEIHQLGMYLPYVVLLWFLFKLPSLRGTERNMDGTLYRRYGNNSPRRRRKR